MNDSSPKNGSKQIIKKVEKLPIAVGVVQETRPDFSNTSGKLRVAFSSGALAGIANSDFSLADCLH